VGRVGHARELQELGNRDVDQVAAVAILEQCVSVGHVLDVVELAGRAEVLTLPDRLIR
jgi:hypothetical protein